MRAVVVTGVNNLAVQNVDLTPEPGEVVLQVKACGICGTDLHALRFPDVLNTGPGTVLGHEFCGEVAEVTAGVEGWRPGDRVVAMPFHTCGNCDECAAGYDWSCVRGRWIGFSHTGVPGALAEYVRASPRLMFRVPEGLSYRHAALTEPVAVALHSVNRARLQRGEPCIVMGAGPVGSLTLIWAKILEAHPIVVSDPLPERRRLALDLGAHAAVDPAEADPVERMIELTRGVRPAVVFDCVGTPSTAEEAMRMAASHGRVVLTGVSMEPYQLQPMTAHGKELDVYYTTAYTHAEFQEAMNALARAVVPADDLISEIIGLDAVPGMFKTLANPTTQVKVLVEPGNETGI